MLKPPTRLLKSPCSLQYKDPGELLLCLKQGNKTAAEHALHFRTLAAEAGWDEKSLKAVYRHSLNEALQVELACQDSDNSLSDFIQLSITLDNLIGFRRRPVTGYPNVLSAVLSTPEPMEIGRVQLAPEEWLRHMCEGLLLAFTVASRDTSKVTVPLSRIPNG
ncbi:hypothetical protein AOLI_G00275440 [Acnodon oligacanthus]